TPIAFTPERKAMHDEHFLTVYGRMKPGIARERVNAELEAVAVRVRRAYPRDAGQLAYRTEPFAEQFVGDYRRRLLVLLGAVGLVLLIACANVANLLLARGTARAREIAVRSALGAERGRIVRQLLTESLVLTATAAAAGVLLAAWWTSALVAWSPEGVPRIEQAHLNAAALAFAIAVALASSIVCGLAPALTLARADVQTALREGGRGAAGGGLRDRLRGALIAAEVALSLVLLVGAGLLIRSALAMQRVQPGYDPAGVLTARFTLPETVYTDPAREQETVRRINEAASRIPGVSASAVTSYVAMGGGGGSNGLVPEGGVPDPSHAINTVLRLTTNGFFAAMRTPIVKGRGFTDDDRGGGQKVMIVSAALAARAFPGQDPLGKRIACCEPGPDNGPSWKVIVGVAGDIRSRGPAVAPAPEFYLPMAQAPTAAWRWYRTFYVVVRGERDPLALVEPLRAAVAGVDRDLPIFDVRTMDQRLARTLATARFNTLLLTLLGAVGLVLAATGIYGVVAYFVGQRTQEIGVRIALGATKASVVRLVVVQAMRPIAIGTGIGLAAAAAATRVLASQLVGVAPTDPLTIAAVVVVLLGSAVVASVVPARHAASIDPTRALQSE
ncbi:MAG TPA: ADOP family duplicated permease, partial [Vicinamibacterales bacterium]|nr:ADOP family duplicated permease [Vicinamibacterales bacterium]